LRVWDGCHNLQRVSAARQRPGELAHRLLMLLVPDLGEVSRDLQQHALVRRDLPGAFLPDAFVEITDRDGQRAGDLEQPASRDAIDPALIFVSLLVGNSDLLGEQLLGETQHDATFSNPPPDMIINRSG
jgi:hypothetical protein